MLAGSPGPAWPQDPGQQRQRMVDEDLRGRNITDERVLTAMGRVPRHRFMDPSQARWAYSDFAQPIGHGQTISQPYVVALMTQALNLKPQERVLEIGTGSGYQAAVLAELVRTVYTIEIIEPLANEARDLLPKLGYNNVNVRHGDGYEGWPQHAPFDAILITAAAPEIPQPLIDQLRVGGRMVLPLENEAAQQLLLVRKQADGITRTIITGVRFVPMTGAVRNP
ncbi:protein-L-isoaspartate(D-aspartate) O-methyltransferase [Nitrospina watsonii]|uniref:Protein-L-isoaspartate O-methyltransferase n=1 Tax=Nitrospina watsonii TaxID=1323948 RepID=A0ABN8VYJ2_9BACT|nr:protein-L-isoaspartate(D-aspartate) O-methyltransferase [Nitrospina watsonii]CAI2717223.1 L-isoaspartate protein carboxylmethyltransferase type II [Nitrospina watsonii]